MYTSSLPRLLFDILDLARLAPSVHNVQPWRCDWDGKKLQLSVAKERMLREGDPTGRELWISIGAFIETIIASADALGISISYTLSDTPSLELPFMTFLLATKKLTGKPELVSAITNRCSDRAAYSTRGLSKLELEVLNDIWKSKHVSVHILSEPNQLATIADMTGQGIAMALSLPGFRQELAQLIRINSSSAHTGLFGYALGYGSLRARLEPYLVRSGRGRLAQAAREEAAWKASGAVAVILTSGDTAEFWLQAGRAYTRVGLVATRLNLHLSTSAAAVEASDFHLEVEKLCGKPTSRLQVIMRLGYSDRKVHSSPRLSVPELFD